MVMLCGFIQNRICSISKMRAYTCKSPSALPLHRVAFVAFIHWISSFKAVSGRFCLSWSFPPETFSLWQVRFDRMGSLEQRLILVSGWCLSLKLSQPLTAWVIVRKCLASVQPLSTGGLWKCSADWDGAQSNNWDKFTGCSPKKPKKEMCVIILSKKS